MGGVGLVQAAPAKMLTYNSIRVYLLLSLHQHVLLLLLLGQCLLMLDHRLLLLLLLQELEMEVAGWGRLGQTLQLNQHISFHLFNKSLGQGCEI